MILISPFSGRLIGRFGARRLMTAGMLFGTAGLVFLTQIDGGSSYGLVLVGYLLFGIALGLVYAPMSTAAMAAMPGEKVGIASGVLAMDRIVAGSLALAATSAAFHALQGERRLVRRLDRRLDLGRGRALRARHRAHLGLRPRRQPARPRSGRRRRAGAGGAASPPPPPPIPPLSEGSA